MRQLFLVVRFNAWSPSIHIALKIFFQHNPNSIKALRHIINGRTVRYIETPAQRHCLAIPFTCFNKVEIKKRPPALAVSLTFF